MPSKPKRPCRFPGCPKLTGNKDGYCDEHLRMRRRDYDRYMRGYVHHEYYGGREHSNMLLGATLKQHA